VITVQVKTKTTMYILWYLAWSVIKGLHSSITINFMFPGHTKFASF